MKFSRKQFISTFIIFILTSLYFNKVQSQDFISFIREVDNYKRSTRLNENFNDIDSTTFNLEEYLGKYDKIKIKNGYLLDYKYFDNSLDGKPYIYAKTDTFILEDFLKQETLKHIPVDTIYKHKVKIYHKVPFDFLNNNNDPKEYKIWYHPDSYDFVFHRKLYKFLTDSVNRGYNYIIPVDSKEGYFQYLYFKEYGEQFCTKWHEAYNSKRIILNKDEILKLIKNYSREEFCKKSEFQKLKNLRQIIPNPQIELSENYCRITLVEEEFYGIYKRTYRINRTFPYLIKVEYENKLVEICPSIMFWREYLQSMN